MHRSTSRRLRGGAGRSMRAGDLDRLEAQAALQARSGVPRSNGIEPDAASTPATLVEPGADELPPSAASGQGRPCSGWIINVSMIFAGFAGGGVWKTSNSGSSWTPLTDFRSRPGRRHPAHCRAPTWWGSPTRRSASVSAKATPRPTRSTGRRSEIHRRRDELDAPERFPGPGPDAATSARFGHSIRSPGRHERCQGALGRSRGRGVTTRRTAARPGRW